MARANQKGAALTNRLMSEFFGGGSREAIHSDLFAMARLCFFNQAENAGKNFLDHFPFMHPSKDRLVKYLQRLAAFDKQDFTNRVDAVIEVGKLKRSLSPRDHAAITGCTRKFLLNIFPKNIILYYRGLLTLAVAKMGDPIRNIMMPMMSMDKTREQQEATAKCFEEDIHSDPVHPILFKFAHSLSRLKEIDNRNVADFCNAAIALSLFILQAAVMNNPETLKKVPAHVHHTPIHTYDGPQPAEVAIQATIESDAENLHAQKTYCDKCGKRPGYDDPPLKVCSRCKKARYCSVDCQKAAWKEHKPGCKAPHS